MFLILRLFFLIILVFVLGFLFFIRQEEQTIITFFNNKQEIAQIKASVAQSEAELQQGLMYVESLPENTGMLFIFFNQQIRSFWMKNTLISLDIIFLDKDKNIINIIKNAKPCIVEQCLSYRSTGPSQYVIEVNTGFVDKFNINQATKISF